LLDLPELNVGRDSLGEALLFFDCLLSDWIEHEGMDVDQFRAACFKYGLQEEEAGEAILTSVC